MSLRRGFIISACLAAGALAADCGGNTGLCKADKDVTSLVQVKVDVHKQPVETHTITHVITQTIVDDAADDQWGNYSQVENSQNDVKGAYSEMLIAKAASAEAEVNKLKARYDALRKSYHMEAKDFDATDAGRAAKKALQDAKYEQVMWQRAVSAEEASLNASLTAEADFEGKADMLTNVSHQAEDATAKRVAAEANAEKVRDEAQRQVDLAKAKQTAKDAYQAKVQAAAAVAAQKVADAKAEKSAAAAKLEKKLLDKANAQALHDDLRAHVGADDAQVASMRAAQAEVDAMLGANASSSSSSSSETKLE